MSEKKAKADTLSQYKGNVTLKLRLKNNKVVTLRKHNNGLITLSKAFAYQMSNHQYASEYVPQYVDLEYIEDPNNMDPSKLSSWQTYLKRIVSISGLVPEQIDKAYKVKGEPNYQPNWVTTCTIVIPYNYLQAPVSPDSQSLFRLYLMTGELIHDPIADRRLAWVSLTAKELSELEYGTELEIIWQLQLVHDPIEKDEEEE